MDNIVAEQLDNQMVKMESWLKTYKKLAGLLFILSTIYFFYQQEYIPALISLGVLHLHILFNYQFKIATGHKIWKVAKENSSENGLKAGQ